MRVRRKLPSPAWTPIAGPPTEARRAGTGRTHYVRPMTSYRFLDGSGDVVAEQEFSDHAAALSWAADEDETDDDIQRVEFLGAEGDWRWAGALQG
jgi:hypothetical protein